MDIYPCDVSFYIKSNPLRMAVFMRIRPYFNRNDIVSQKNTICIVETWWFNIAVAKKRPIRDWRVMLAALLWDEVANKRG